MSDENKDRGDVVDESLLVTAGKEAEEAAAAAAETAKGDKLDDENETEEEKAEREKAEEEARKKANIRIPKARFDEVQAKARAREAALQAEIEKLRGSQRQTEAEKTVDQMRTKIDELQEKYEDLILDGKKEDARKVRKQVEALRDELSEYRGSEKADRARAQAIDEVTYNQQLDSVESKYPKLDPEHADYDKDTVAEVAELLTAMVKAGSRRADALGRAVRYVLGAPSEPRGAKTGTDQRDREAREKAAKADKQQPASSAKVGLDSDKAGKAGEQGIDIMRLSQDKFSKLDEETKSRLRGDTV